MKKKLFALLVVFFVSSIQMFPVEDGRSLTNILNELRGELNAENNQRTQLQEIIDDDFQKQYLRMINVITQSNEISILLYTQEMKKTFDMTFALNKVTEYYEDFNQNRRPYDQIISGLDFEIDRYARLIEALRRLPPEMKEIEVELLPDSLQYRNDSLDNFLSNTPSSLEKEIIRISVKDSASVPFGLNEAGERYRDSCILYASELLKMYADNRDSVLVDSIHYQEAYLRTKEAYDYAEAQYRELGRYVFSGGQTPYVEILADFRTYWDRMRREYRNSYYGFEELSKAREEYNAEHPNEKFSKAVTGRLEKTFTLFSCVVQIITLLFVWIVLFVILRLLCRFTKLRNYIPWESLPLFSVLFGTILYFLFFGYFWEGSEKVRSGVKNLNTVLWLFIAISGSLLLRAKSGKIHNSIRLYVPTFLLALVIIFCRNTFVPDILLNIIFTPVLLIAVFGQLLACLRERGRVPRTDSVLGWVSLAVYVITLVIAFSGNIFAALIDLVWWYFMLTILLAVFCVSDLLSRYKEKRLDKRVAEKRKRITYVSGNDRETMLFGVTWFYDLVKQVLLPVTVLLALPWSIRVSLDIFDFSDIFTHFYGAPFIHTPNGLSVSMESIVFLAILFCILRYLNRVIHVIWHYSQYSAFMRKNKRTSVRTNEINLSLGNSIITVLVWTIYAMVVIVTWKIPTGSLGLIAGGLSAGIGIALKDILNNFIYGIQLMGGRLRVGDWIECDGVRGKVTAIGYQCVQVETVDGTEMSFLNESLFGKNFNNLTRNNSYEFTKIVVGVAYGTDVQKVREVLVEAMQQLRTKDNYGREIVDAKKGVYVTVDNMSDSSVDIAVKQYVLVAERIGYVDRAKEVIYEALNAAGISIPFPQCDVHLIKE